MQNRNRLTDLGYGIKRYKLLCIKQMSNKDILYSIGNYSHCLIITFNGEYNL